MQKHERVANIETGQSHWQLYASDLHYMSPSCDVKRFQADLDDARRVNARCILNGDMFDAIGQHDKRFTPTTLIKALRGSDDLKRDSVISSVKIYEPYVDMIDVIGIGNHEETWIKWGGFDPVADLIERLNNILRTQKSEHRIRHGAFCGFYRTKFVMPHRQICSHTTYYYHGAGGDSPVTLGTIDFNRKQVAFDADLITCGHKHNMFWTNGVRCSLSPHGYIQFKERICMQTGSYYHNYIEGTQEHPLEYPYAESRTNQPKPMGGFFVNITPSYGRMEGQGNSKCYHIKQIVMNGIPPEFKPRPKKKGK